ncbi:MAG: hypothetical protein WBM08_07925, partial [Prochlorococcaceae cyanobacterium]
SLQDPLFGPAAWRLALIQGGLLLVVVLALALGWPLGGDLLERRTLVISVLLLASGGLVWINRVRLPTAAGPSPEMVGGRLVTAAVAGSGLLLWALILGWSPLRQLLLLAPFSWGLMATGSAVAALSLALISAASVASGATRARPPG